jgi:hypothetical protein
VTDPERLRRWRLVLGGEDDGTGATLTGEDLARDRALDALYGSGADDRGSGLGASAPRVARWLGDVRELFPSSVVRVMQRDAMDRLGLHELLLEPELLGTVEPDVHLVGTLLSLSGGDSGTFAGDGARRRPAGRRGRRAAAGAAHARGGDRGAAPCGADAPAAAAGRRRLESHHPAEPQALPARAPHRGARDARRARSPLPGARARRGPVHRPERLHGGVGDLRERVRGGARVTADRADAARGLRHGGRRPHGRAPRPGRTALRRPAGRRNGH